MGQANQLDEQGVPWEVVPNFVPDSLLSARDLPRDPALPEGDYLFYAGDLSEQKGVDTVLAAYATLDPATRPALVLVGRTAMDLSSLPDGAVVHEKWEHERVLSGFGHALAAVLPSRWPDPCPTTVLEAMALGAPLVTTHMGGIADMVVDGESALVVPPGDVAATAAALTRMIADPELRARLVGPGVGGGAALPPERGRRAARGDLRGAASPALEVLPEDQAVLRQGVAPVRHRVEPVLVEPCVDQLLGGRPVGEVGRRRSSPTSPARPSISVLEAEALHERQGHVVPAGGAAADEVVGAVAPAAGHPEQPAREVVGVRRAAEQVGDRVDRRRPAPDLRGRPC